MAHPLTSDNDDALHLRRRMRQFLFETAHIVRHSNIIFICGGNNENHHRQQFRNYARSNLKEFKVFFPEYAIKTAISNRATKFIDLAQFEELVANLSVCVVIFPEAPGSYTELGMFSVLKNIAEKTLVVLNSREMDVDSFVTNGATLKVDQISDFRHAIQLDYNKPEYDRICARIKNRFTPFKNLQHFGTRRWSELDDLTIFKVVHWLVDLCRLSSVDSIHFLVRSLFGNSQKSKIEDICSIMIGSGEFFTVGQEGWICKDPESAPFLKAPSKFEGRNLELRQRILDYYQNYEDFYEVFQEAYR